MDKNDLSTQYGAESKRNKIALITVGVTNVVLILAYGLQAKQGHVPVPTYIIMALLCAIPTIISVLLYLRRSDNPFIKYILGVFFVLMYFFVMTTRTTNMTFCYMALVLIGLMVQGNIKLILAYGLGCFLLNIYGTFSNQLGGDNFMAEAEISILFILLGTIYAAIVTKAIAQINNAAQNKIGGVVETVKGVVDDMLGNIKDIDHISNDLNQSINTTKTQMETLNKGAAESSDELQMEQQKSLEITSQLAMVSENANQIASMIDQANANVAQSQNTMNELLAAVQKSDEMSKGVADRLMLLQSDTEKMQSILSVISQIASQTNLLSINASIEAARAGEAGKGFNVVAEEISGLAKQTTQATQNIGELINSLSNSLTETTKAINEMLENSTHENEQITDTANALEKISGDVNSIYTTSVSLAEQIASANDANSSIATAIEHSSAVTQEVSASASETLRVSEENLASVERLTSVVLSLEDGANKLQEI